jgi:phosphoglycerate dehydrogenase-like enzyme
MPSADVVILAAAATPDTHHSIGARELALLPSHAVLVNVARGSLLDHDALVEALSTDALWGAALDVTDPEPLPDDHPLWQITRCVITSHSADTPLMTAHLLGTRIERNVTAFLKGTPFIGIVDTRAGY